MRIAVAGGALQGCEAAYLALKAGWSTILIDRRESVPAAGLCDRHVRLDLLAEESGLERLLEQVDLVVPALEDGAALARLQQAATRAGVPLAHDAAAYAVTFSKKRSDALFAAHGIPAPRSWPECGLPAFAKPSESSGSRGVRRITDAGEVERLTGAGDSGDEWVVQEFLEGNSYSIEVLGYHGTPIPLQVTDLEMDPVYDCRRVTAPTRLPPHRVAEFRKLAAGIAGLIGLHGIMDVEVIDHGGVLKVLEIDARLPSQTPAAVYCSTGVNMLASLYEIFVLDRLPVLQTEGPPRTVIYEHILVTRGRLDNPGEHVMAAAGPLRLETDFFGADEAITDYTPGAGCWVATLIHMGSDKEEAWSKRRSTLETLRRQHRLTLADPLSHEGVC